MIDTKDIRVGNWFHHTSEWSYRNRNMVEHDFQWSESDWLAFGESKIDTDDIDPIPLTEEWLINLAFTYGEGNNGWMEKYYFTNCKEDNGMYMMAINFNSKRFCIYDTDDGQPAYAAKDIEYVHQLQNLFHALTGEELTINQ